MDTIVDPYTTLCCKAERFYLKKIGFDCFSPIGVWARVVNNKFIITGYIANLDGSYHIQHTIDGKIEYSQEIALKLASKMIKNGAKTINL